jgi:nucleotide-binding universal stress UspA family protein
MGKILLATDGSEPAHDAATYAIQLSKGMGLGLVALRVVDIERYTYDWEAVREDVTRELESHAQRILDDVQKAATEAGIEVDCQVRHGDSSREIIRMAHDDPDIVLIVMGSSGRRRLGRQLIGSTAERVVRQVGRDLPCAVTITPSVVTNPDARIKI